MDPDTLVIDIRDDEPDLRDEAGRFKRGVSGNPLGRPLGSRRVQALARAPRRTNRIPNARPRGGGGA